MMDDPAKCPCARCSNPSYDVVGYIHLPTLVAELRGFQRGKEPIPTQRLAEWLAERHPWLTWRLGRLHRDLPAEFYGGVVANALADGDGTRELA